MSAADPEGASPDRPAGPTPGQADISPPSAAAHPGLGRLLRRLGPGLVTGAADDPSGIAAYAQTGAQFGYGQLWTAVWMLPLLIAVQEACGVTASVAALVASRVKG